MRNYFKLLIVFILGKFKPKKKEIKLEKTVNVENLINELLSYESSENKHYDFGNSDNLDAIRFTLYDKLPYSNGNSKTDNQNKPNPTE